MRALFVKKPGHLVLKEAKDPPINGEELLLEVKAFGVNHADLLQSHGKYPPPPGVTDILGLEAAGVVLQIGKNVKNFKPGDRIMSLLPGGGYAEKVAIHEKLCMPIPSNLTFEKAAAIPEVFLTAYQALFLIGEIRPEQHVLIHAAAGGVGTAALQLTREAGAHTIGTTRSKAKLEKLLHLGCERVINTSDGLFAEKIQEMTEGHGVDLILDFVGASYFTENMHALAKGGALIFASTLGGKIIEKFDLRLLMHKWATLSGTTLRNRSIEYRAKLIVEFSHFALSRFEEKNLRPIIDKILPWEEVNEAHKQIAQNQVFGKIILKIQ